MISCWLLEGCWLLLARRLHSFAVSLNVFGCSAGNAALAARAACLCVLMCVHGHVVAVCACVFLCGCVGVWACVVVWNGCPVACCAFPVSSPIWSNKCLAGRAGWVRHGGRRADSLSQYRGG